MRLVLLTVVTMTAFAANSVLTRAAVEGAHADPLTFAIVRVLAGAAMLTALVVWREGTIPPIRRNQLPGALSLALYMIGFSLAYSSLDAGLGALILFGVVQIVIFLHSSLTGQPPTIRQMAGAAMAFAGLLIALWPGPGGQADPTGASLMVLAGIGWAVYTIAGRSAARPLVSTAANFILCLPFVAIFVVFAGLAISPFGLVLGLICGGLTSGMGYALWYHVLPQITSTTAAIVQLVVPILAILGGAILLAEPISGLVLVAAALVVGGIGWAVTQNRT